MKLGWFVAIVVSVLMGFLVYLGVELRFAKGAEFSNAIAVLKVERAMNAFYADNSSYPEGTNPEIAVSLKGENPLAKAYLERGVPKENGVLLDTWRSPLIIAVVGGQPQVTSSGPDRQAGTPDDIGSSAVLKMGYPADPSEELVHPSLREKEEK